MADTSLPPPIHATLAALAERAYLAGYAAAQHSRIGSCPYTEPTVRRAYLAGWLDGTDAANARHMARVALAHSADSGGRPH